MFSPPLVDFLLILGQDGIFLADNVSLGSGTGRLNALDSSGGIAGGA